MIQIRTKLYIQFLLASQQPCEVTITVLIYRFKKLQSAEKLVTSPTAPGRNVLIGEFEPRSILLQSLHLSPWTLPWDSYPPGSAALGS